MGKRKEIWSWIKSLAIAIVLALLIREYVLAFYVVDGNSMQPTLENGEMVAVNKIVYRFSPPDRGEVVVFAKEGEEIGLDKDRVFIKRVIALPGDKVEIVDGELFINEELQEEDYISAQLLSDYELQTVPRGMYFVMGDNRNPNGSWDSRDPDFGPVLKDTILGRADLIVFPIPGKLR